MNDNKEDGAIACKVQLKEISGKRLAAVDIKIRPADTIEQFI